MLDLQKTDPELLKIFQSFSHLTGNYRSNLTHAVWEAQAEIKMKDFDFGSELSKAILTKAFKKWGI